MKKRDSVLLTPVGILFGGTDFGLNDVIVFKTVSEAVSYAKAAQAVFAKAPYVVLARIVNVLVTYDRRVVSQNVERALIKIKHDAAA